MAAARSPNRTVGAAADLAMLDAPDPVTALRTVVPVLAAFKRPADGGSRAGAPARAVMR